MPQIAYRAIRGRRKFSQSRQVIQELERTLDNVVKPHFIKQFEMRVANWEHKVTFEARKFITPNSISINVYPTGPNKDIWKYNTLGTRPHTIRAKHAPALSFMGGGAIYVSKTAPGGKYGGPGIVYGGYPVYAKKVNHPGTEAREWESVIAKQNKQWYSQTMENAWRRAIRSL